MDTRIKHGTARQGARRRRPAGPVISLNIPHTRCPRCRVWARRNPCPHCGASKAAVANPSA